MASLLIILAIGVYAGFVIKRQISNWKKGKYCGSNCDGCSGGCHKDLNK
ncbi:FeoB-associated Cys-rich membrane protein [Anaerosacchariphilus polymeriproducens]|uniref:FeoB-associated Cys-rich membrane protein n=1 Tax=Anaerosacchariphilus polymeriproducens TaxID=1812858 RepID=A0A371AXH5_9FIRM|nr:FeoB-associated Cys-rich membrane protein [Anaerosacchariphilus polymeriproducens]RDU24264.1 FeoB-associated Cys-rich membrane protein [Anaerosacchariphilus polymeriproducens]